MVSMLGMKFHNPYQLKQCLSNYAVAYGMIFGMKKMMLTGC